MLYLLEDDSSIREFVAYALKSRGYEVEGFALPSEFWAAMEKRQPRLLILDIMLPEESGLDILRRLRADPNTRRLPVILLTAMGTEYDKVVGLDAGADDYLPKPFGILELLSRVQALLRRAEPDQPAAEFRLGDLYVCPPKHQVKVAGAPVELTVKEFSLLCLLLENPGVVFTRDQLLDHVWGYAYDGESRTVDVHIRTLRQKLGPCGSIIETVRGLGYRLAPRT